jgi:hypothetical protein
MMIFKKIMKGVGILLVVLLCLGFSLYLIYNKPLPQGEKGEEALALVRKIQTAINQNAWDKTRYIEWTFRGANHYVWDKKRHLVRVKWDDYEVFLNPSTLKGQIYKNNEPEEYDTEIMDKANFNFTNDAFWLNAPSQLKRDGMEYRTVVMDDGSKALLVTYMTGGVTPGDSYLWILDEDGLPKAWQMWVNIIPIGGLEVSWADWTTLSTGAKIATTHDAGFLSIPISNVKSYQTWQEGGLGKDIFEGMD